MVRLDAWAASGAGANSEDVDASVFKAAYKGFVDSGYRMRALLKGLALSPDFFSTPAPTQEASIGQTKLASSP